jgi:hypothetical protein
MKSYLLLGIAMLLAVAASAEEIDGEVSVSILADPYKKVQPGFGGSYRPEFLQFDRFSLGAGLMIHISDRFLYADNSPQVWPDSVPVPREGGANTQWYYERDFSIEFVDFDFSAEARYQLLSSEDERGFKAFLALNAGFIINSGARYEKLTNFLDSTYNLGGNDLHTIVDFAQAEYTLKTQYRTDAYLSPGLLLGLGNFYFGYRHWLYFDSFDIVKGEPARMLGTVRLGYRFIW